MSLSALLNMVQEIGVKALTNCDMNIINENGYLSLSKIAGKLYPNDGVNISLQSISV